MENIREYEAPYRSRRGTEDDEQTSQSNYFMGRIILTQFLVFALLLITLFLFHRTGGERFEALKGMYNSVTQKDYTVSEIIGSAKNVMSFLLEDRKNETEEQETTENTTAVSEEITEEGAGGDDLISPRENASFSPFYISLPMAKPINSERITSKFGYRINPVTNEYGFHSGLDIGAPEGTEIYAAFNGIVEKADCSSMRGNYIILASSENIKTVYCHCSELLVSEGECVKAGQPIALVGSTGQATGPHLHFEIRINDIYYNPEWLINN